MQRIGIITVLFLLSMTTMCCATSLRAERPLGININICGPSFLTLSLDYYFTAFNSIEIGGGYIGYYLGTTYIFSESSNNKGVVYLGGYYSLNSMDFPDFRNTGSLLNVIYVPFGYKYFFKSGMNIGFEAGAIFNTDNGKTNPFGGFKFGYRF